MLDPVSMFELRWWYVPVLFCVGAGAGFLNVMAGGGSLVSMSIMQSMGMAGSLANGTNRLAILLQNVSASISFYRQGIRHIRESLFLALFALPGCLVGAHIGTAIDGIWFRRMLAVIMVVLLTLMFARRKGEEQQELSVDNVPVVSLLRRVSGYVLLMLVGLYGGIIQAGVGYLIILILHRVMGYSLVRTNAHKVVIIGVYTILAILVFARSKDVVWVPAVALAAGNMVGAWFGASFAVKKGEHMVRKVVLATMSVIALYLVARSI